VQGVPSLTLKIRAFLAVLLLLFVGQAGVGATYRGDLYSEQIVLTRKDQFASSARFRFENVLSPFLSPYLQVGSELMSPVGNIGSLDTASYVHVGPGVKLSYKKFSLLVEGRFRKFYKELAQPSGTQGNFDFRTLLIYGNFFQKELQGSLRLRRFAEIYSETVFTSADDNNVIHSSYARLGYRLPLSPQTNADLFLEPYVTLDRIGHFYNNRTDLKLSARLTHFLSPLSFSLMASVLANQYFSFGDYEPNPYKNSNTGFRFMAIIGGVL